MFSSPDYDDGGELLLPAEQMNNKELVGALAKAFPHTKLRLFVPANPMPELRKFPVQGDLDELCEPLRGGRKAFCK